MATPKPPQDAESAIQLAIGSRLELLSLIHAVIEGIAREQNLDEETTMALQVAIIEAGTNAIQHGNVFAETKAVKFEFRLQNGGIEVEVEDYGKGFDPSKVEDPTMDESHLLSPHGRGLFLMRSLMDEVTFEERPDHGTKVLLKKSISGS